MFSKKDYSYDCGQKYFGVQCKITLYLNYRKKFYISSQWHDLKNNHYKCIQRFVFSVSYGLFKIGLFNHVHVSGTQLIQVNSCCRVGVGGTGPFSEQFREQEFY